MPLLSPVLMHFGKNRPAWWIQTVYHFLCHQRPERSLFFFGERLTYTVQELENLGYNVGLIGYTFVGNEEIGYKVAFCVRDTFIYSTMAVTGIIVSALNKTVTVKWWWAVILSIPMALDGGIQFISEFLYLSQESFGLSLENPFYLSNNLNRAITGALFGIGVGLFIFSELKKATQE